MCMSLCDFRDSFEVNYPFEGLKLLGLKALHSSLESEGIVYMSISISSAV